MIESQPCGVWMVEFAEGVRKLVVTKVDDKADDVVLYLKRWFPNSQFLVHRVDSALLTLPDEMQRGDALWASDGRKINQGLVVDEPAPDEPDIDRTITFLPPGFKTEQSE